MQPPRRLTKIFDTLGMLGLMMRSKRISAFDETSETREWGPVTEGFALSILAVPGVAGLEEPVKLTLALRNGTGGEIRETVPSWLGYFELSIVTPAGTGAARTAYGRALLESSPHTSMSAVLSPPRPLYVELPLSDIYGLSAPGTYRVSSACPVPAGGPGAKCRSNEITITRRERV